MDYYQQFPYQQQPEMDYYQQFPYQQEQLPQQPEIDYRQQGQFFPGGGAVSISKSIANLKDLTAASIN